VSCVRAGDQIAVTLAENSEKIKGIRAKVRKRWALASEGRVGLVRPPSHRAIKPCCLAS
jgi:hypothetical protein